MLHSPSSWKSILSILITAALITQFSVACLPKSKCGPKDTNCTDDTVDAGDSDAGTDAGMDADTDAGNSDSGTDAGSNDAGNNDSGVDSGGDDSGTDAGDAGNDDGGSDAGEDGGSDAGNDAGPIQHYLMNPDLIFDATRVINYGSLNSCIIDDLPSLNGQETAWGLHSASSFEQDPSVDYFNSQYNDMNNTMFISVTDRESLNAVGRVVQGQMHTSNLCGEPIPWPIIDPMPNFNHDTVKLDMIVNDAMVEHTGFNAPYQWVGVRLWIDGSNLERPMVLDYVLKYNQSNSEYIFAPYRTENNTDIFKILPKIFITFPYDNRSDHNFGNVKQDVLNALDTLGYDVNILNTLTIRQVELRTEVRDGTASATFDFVDIWTQN
jgi:hypothetical protein